MIARNPARWRADLALGAVALIWGATFVVVKRALTDISTMYFLAVRFALASLCLGLIFFGPFRRMPARELWRGLAGGVGAGIFLWLGYALQTQGLKYTSAGNSGFITGLYVVLVPLLGAVFFRRRPQIRELAGIALATAGMFVMTFPTLDKHFHMNKGDLLTLGCAVAFSFHLLVLGYFSQRERFEPVSLGQIASAALLSTVALVFDLPRASWSGEVIFAIVMTAVFATALAFALMTWAQQYTTATRTALIFALEPVFALTTAVFAGEPLTAASVCGGSLILIGILAVELKPAQQG